MSKHFLVHTQVVPDAGRERSAAFVQALQRRTAAAVLGGAGERGELAAHVDTRVGDRSLPRLTGLARRAQRPGAHRLDRRPRRRRRRHRAPLQQQQDD